MGSGNVSSFKKNCVRAGGILLFEDEASFRQDPTLFRSWFRVGSEPQVLTLGQRNTQHVYGAISIIPFGRFSYHFINKGEKFNAGTYQKFLLMLLHKFYPKKIFLIQDNASYHKNPDMLSWFEAHRQKIGHIPLPSHSPELNAAEPLWGYTRRETTHNNFFAHVNDLISGLRHTFRKMQYHPELIGNYIQPYV